MIKRSISPALVTLLCVAIASCSPAGASYGEKIARAINGTTTSTPAMSTMASSTAAAASASPTVPYASDDPNAILWTGESNANLVNIEPMRGTLGAPILGPQNIPIELQNADMLAPPTTDFGDV